jgi:hypothetical protein
VAIAVCSVDSYICSLWEISYRHFYVVSPPVTKACSLLGLMDCRLHLWVSSHAVRVTADCLYVLSWSEWQPSALLRFYIKFTLTTNLNCSVYTILKGAGIAQSLQWRGYSCSTQGSNPADGKIFLFSPKCLGPALPPPILIFSGHQGVPPQE